MADQPTPEAARAQIEAIKSGTDAGSSLAAAYRDPWNPDLRADVAKLNELYAAADATGPVQPATGSQITQADALARLAKINAGGEPELRDKFLGGDAEARQLMEDLHKAAYPEPDVAPEDPELISGSLPIVFDADVPLEQQVEVQTIAKEAVAGIGLDRETAIFSINALQQATSLRNNEPMSAAELDTFDKMMSEKWGANFAQKMERVWDAFQDAGRGKQWLKAACYAAGPEVAAHIFDTLANLPPKRVRR